MRLVRRFILFVVVALSGCGGQTTSPPTQSPTVPSASVVAHIQPTSGPTPGAVATPSVEPDDPTGLIAGVRGRLAGLEEPQTDAGVYTVRLWVRSDFVAVDAPEAGTITSTVTITFSGEGIIQDLHPTHITHIITPGVTIFTTTFTLNEQGQGRVYANFWATTPSKHACMTHEFQAWYDLLSTDLGVFTSATGSDERMQYLTTARDSGSISAEEYDQQMFDFWNWERGTTVQINGVPQQIIPFTPRPEPPFLDQCMN